MCGGLVLLVYIDLVVVSLEMVFVIRDATCTLHCVSLMEEIVDLKDDELSAPQCCSMCVLPICMHVLWPCIQGIVCVYSSHPMSPSSNVSSAPPLCSFSLPAEWSLVDANQGYTGGVEWEGE